MGAIFGYISYVFSSCLNWFTLILESSGMLSVFLAGFGIFCIYKFLLSPLFGRAGSSDKAKKKKSDD